MFFLELDDWMCFLRDPSGISSCAVTEMFWRSVLAYVGPGYEGYGGCEYGSCIRIGVGQVTLGGIESAITR